MTVDAAVADRPEPASGDADVPVRLDEELMIYQVPQVWAQLDAAIRAMAGRGGALRVDGTHLHELDGAGLQLLLLAGRHLDALGASLEVVGLNARMHAQLRAMDRAGVLVLRESEAA